MNQKKRVITSYEKLGAEQLAELKLKYPNGYSDYVTKIEKGNGDFFYAIPLETEDASYLIKVQVNIDKLDDAENLPFETNEPADFAAEVAETNDDEEEEAAFTEIDDDFED